MLSAFNLSYGDTDTMFAGVGFCLPPGSLMAVQGPRTAPTHLLEILSGARKPSSGAVMLDGKALRRRFWHNPCRSHMLYLGNNTPAPDQRQTVKEAVTQAARQQGSTMLVDAALYYFDLLELQHRPLSDLPASFQKRVMLAPLLASPKLIWLLDEPALSLDKAGEALLYALIANRCNQRGIVIIATQQPAGIAPIQALDLNDFA